MDAATYTVSITHELGLLDASSKHIYRSFLAKKQTTPTAKEKLQTVSAKYHLIDWKRVYLLSFCTTLEKKLKGISVQNIKPYRIYECETFSF